MAKSRIGQLNVLLSLNAVRFNQGLKRSQRRVSGFTRRVSNMGKRLFFIRQGFAGVGKAMNFIKPAIDRLDDLAATGAKLGIATPALKGLQNAARLTNVTVQTFNNGLQRMVRRVSEAAKGTGEAKGALAELGLDARKLTKLSPDQQFLAVAQAMDRVASATDKVRLAMKLFDTDGVALVNTLDLGAVALQKHIKWAESLGDTYGAGAKRVAELNQQLVRNAIITESLADRTVAANAKGATEMAKLGSRVVGGIQMFGKSLAAAGAAGAAFFMDKAGTLVGDSQMQQDAGTLFRFADSVIDDFAKEGTAAAGVGRELPGGRSGGSAEILRALEQIENNTRSGAAPQL